MSKPIEIAPRDGTKIIGIFEDGSECEMMWAEQRQCMLAGTGGGNGYFDAGWQDVENRLVIFDEPIAWKDLT